MAQWVLILRGGTARRRAAEGGCGSGRGRGRGRGAGAGCGGPRLIAACFAALAVAVTVALLAQIYSGDYQAGGRAADAAAAAALCLALLTPHRTSLDARWRPVKSISINVAPSSIKVRNRCAAAVPATATAAARRCERPHA
ncbi:hypothetical protein MSG28_002573 [Choristoneura fumiferana]|uniref:Uncharacterized protein n=1 Tax=Choristoneura fumiferana TaxID=7141 RepID=A0ACC0JW41_CHOFU|nr:hypothetical protein MSG28_002573 [Choristoneura fumiferana]